MACQFTFLVVFCYAFNFFSLYYIVIFCNIYQKSKSSLFQAVFLSILIDMVIVETCVPFVQSGFRSIIKSMKLT